MMNRQPIHPGIILKEMYIRPLGMRISDLSAKLGLHYDLVHDLLNGDARVSTTIAALLASNFDTTVDLWLQLQYNYDKYIEKKPKLGLKLIFSWYTVSNSLRSAFESAVRTNSRA